MLYIHNFFIGHLVGTPSMDFSLAIWKKKKDREKFKIYEKKYNNSAVAAVKKGHQGKHQY